MIILTKKCTMLDCEFVGLEQPIDSFTIDRHNKKDGRKHRCRLCVKKYDRKRNAEKFEEIKIRKKKWKMNNKERVNKTRKEWLKNNSDRVKLWKNNFDPVKRYNARLSWRKRNPEKIKNSLKKYRQKNPEKCHHLSALNKAKRKNAAPHWLSKEHLKNIKLIYEARKLAEKLDLEFGGSTKYQVDHIIPLSGKTVCGLHVPWNLQILPEEINRKKGNKLLVEVNNE